MPNALPLILTGVRISAVQVVATATLGAFVGFGGLGAFINEGFRQQDDGKLLTGAVLVAVLAIVTELAFGVVQRPLTPWLTRKATHHDQTDPDGRWALALLLPFALVAAACGDDDDVRHDGRRRHRRRTATTACSARRPAPDGAPEIIIGAQDFGESAILAADLRAVPRGGRLRR